MPCNKCTLLPWLVKTKAPPAGDDVHKACIGCPPTHLDLHDCAEVWSRIDTEDAIITYQSLI